MGFQSVYRTLQELFPQVDARLLKAAAIEHSKDPDGAVEFILTEVIPHSMKQFDTYISVNGSIGSSVGCQRQCFSACAGSSKHESTAAGEAVAGSKEMNSPHQLDLAYLNETVHDPLDSKSYDAKDIDDQLSRNSGSKKLTVSKTCEETGHKAVQDASIHDISVSPTVVEIHKGKYTQEENDGFEETYKLHKYQDLDLQTAAHSALSTAATLEDAFSNLILDKQSVNLDSDFDPVSGDSDVAVPTQSHKKQPIYYGDPLNGSNYVELASLSIKDHSLDSLDCSIQSDVDSVMCTSNFENSVFSCISEAAFKEDIQVPDDVHIEESSSAQTIFTQNGQVCSTDLLERIIEESKNHKKKLLFDMESVLKLMREVEFGEKVAGQAKTEALSGGLEIRAKVDELKRMLNHAREANDVQSGEVYGERAILATEIRELQSRLLALSDLKKKSLSILDEMLQALEARLTAAEMERIAAEQEKYEREGSAQRALAEQELIKKKVVQEAKILHQEAEENAKLRELLISCGRVVDILQGEISIICQDVKLLKEKLDKHVPLSESLFSEQTNCVLVSSGSSGKSTESEQALEHDKSSTSSDPILLPSAEQVTTNSQKEQLHIDDEGWELFEDAV